MKDIRPDIKKAKTWFLLVTYAVVLVFVVINFNNILGFLRRILGLLQPFFYGIIIAFVINIPMKRIEAFLKKHISETNWFYKRIRAISVVLAMILALVIVGALLSIIIPQIISSVVNLAQNIVGYANGLLNNIDQIFAFLHLDPPDIEINNTTVNALFSELGLNWNSIINNLGNMVTGTSNNLFGVVSQFSMAVINWFMGFMISIYLLTSKETFIRQSKKVVAAVFSWDVTQDIMTVASRANAIFQMFVGGQLVEACIIGLLEYAALTVFNIPFAVLNGCIVSIMALIPVFGPTIACIVGALLVLSVDPIKAIWFVVIYQVVQQFENTVIYPRVVGKSVGLPGLWTLLAIVVFGGMFGIIGMITAVPLTAVIYSFGSEIVNRNLRKKQLVVTTEEVVNNAQEGSNGENE